MNPCIEVQIRSKECQYKAADYSLYFVYWDKTLLLCGKYKYLHRLHKLGVTSHNTIRASPTFPPSRFSSGGGYGLSFLQNSKTMTKNVVRGSIHGEIKICKSDLHVKGSLLVLFTVQVFS